MLPLDAYLTLPVIGLAALTLAHLNGTKACRPQPKLSLEGRVDPAPAHFADSDKRGSCQATSGVTR